MHASCPAPATYAAFALVVATLGVVVFRIAKTVTNRQPLPGARRVHGNNSEFSLTGKNADSARIFRVVFAGSTVHGS